MKVKTGYQGCEYITAWKEYDVLVIGEGSAKILDDYNEETTIILAGTCGHIGWSVLPEVSDSWQHISEGKPGSGQLCLFVIPTSIQYVVAGRIGYGKRWTDAPILDQYGRKIGYDADCISHWRVLEVPAIQVHCTGEGL